MSKEATHFRLALYLTFAATFLLYGVGLPGPFLFDDNFNLAPLTPWLAGDVGWREVVFGNVSGPFGRPVSMLSFLFSAWAGDSYPYQYKLGNLAIHLACGILCFALLRRLTTRDARLANYALPMATAATMLWLLHPLHVSTVLYVIQRMAQLSTLFVLASLLAYLAGRRRLEAGERKPAIIWLFLVLPTFCVLGVLSKENAVVAPGLCLVIEIAYFSRDAVARRILGLFYVVTVALPACAVGLILALRPHLLLAGYDLRDFGMLERLLSQSRALMSYIGLILFPRGSELGLYTDGFEVSTGLLTPATTALSILALSAVSVMAFVLRRRAPSVFAGWFFFLVAHGVESSILPLELYYEHRNYLPSIGILLMLAGLIGLLPDRILSNTRLRATAAAITLLVAVGFGTITYQQALVWRSKDSIVEHAVVNQPGSVRAIQAKAISAINKGFYDVATELLTPLTANDNPRTRSLTYIDLTSISCLRNRGTDPSWLDKAVLDAQDKLTIGEIQAIGLLLQSNKDSRCEHLGPRRVADTITAIADKARAQPDDAFPKWQLRYAAAIAYSRAKLWPETLTQARLAWQAPSTPEVGGLLVQALAHNGRRVEAEQLLGRLEKRIDSRDKQGQEMLQSARAALSGTTVL